MANIIDKINEKQINPNVPEFRVGDTVRVDVKIIEGKRERIQAFEGVVVARRGGSVSETFTVRKMSSGVGVERTFPMHSPKIAKVEVKREGKVRRAKLYYLRDRVGKAAKTKEKVGEHIGLMYYTLGQRRGLNLGGNQEKSYVARKDLDNNILYVASGDENKYLYSTTAILEEFNFLTELRPNKCTCKFRYRQKDIDVEVEYLENNMIKLTYEGAKAVTPGQFCVLYQNDLCLGGGIIKEVNK